MGRLANSLRKLIGSVVTFPAAMLPTSALEEAATRLVIRRARRLSSDEALRLMFRVDARLYAEQGRQAVRYGGGVHTKHRHMKYHDFFLDRVRCHERVLDIGCGIGALALSLAQRNGVRVVGIDCNREHLEQARREHAHPRVEYVHGDVLNWLPKEKFDVVVLSNVLEHLPGRPEFLRRAAEISGARRFLIRVPMFERDWRVPLKRELGVEWRQDADHETEYLVPQFRREVEDAGMRVDYLSIQWGEIWSENTNRAAAA